MIKLKSDEITNNLYEAPHSRAVGYLMVQAIDGVCIDHRLSQPQQSCGV